MLDLENVWTAALFGEPRTRRLQRNPYRAGSPRRRILICLLCVCLLVL